MPNMSKWDQVKPKGHANRSEHGGVERNHHPAFLAVVVWGVAHLISPFHSSKHNITTSISREVLNSTSKNGKQKDEAQGDDSLSLEYGDGLFGKVSRRLFTSNGITPTRFQFKTSRRVSPFSPKGHVSGGTSPQTRTSDPSKCRTRLWTQLTALYGDISARISRLGALYLVTGRVGYDKSHGQLYGDLILCSSTAWYSLGTGNCGRRNIAERKRHG